MINQPMEWGNQFSDKAISISSLTSVMEAATEQKIQRLQSQGSQHRANWEPLQKRPIDCRDPKKNAQETWCFFPETLPYAMWSHGHRGIAQMWLIPFLIFFLFSSRWKSPISDSHLKTSSMGNPLTHVHNHQFSVFKGELSMVKSQFLPIKIH